MLLEAGLAVAALQFICSKGLGSGEGGMPVPTTDLVVFAGLMTLSASAMGLYNARLRDRFQGLLLRLALAAAVTFSVLLLLTWLIPTFEVTARQFSLALLVAVSGDFLLRYVFSRMIREDMFKRRVLVYGAGRQAESISALKRRSDRIGFHIAGYVPTEGDVNAIDVSRQVRPADLLEYCERHDIDEIVVAMDDRRRAFPVHDLLQCRLHGIGIIELLSFLERETGKVRLDVLNPSWMIFSGGFRRSFWRDAVGRVLDLVASLLLLAVGWPVILLTAIAIKLEDGWRAPVLYRQARVGQGGKVFEVLKFRSMRMNAEADGVARWAEADDERITNVGNVIRQLRIDELPQLFNILAGDMRFVGPRPERPEFVEELSVRIPYYRERHVVKPGLTGWAQLCYPYGSSEQDAAEKLQYDLYYIKNHNLFFDLAILVQTVEVILFGKGAR